MRYVISISGPVAVGKSVLADQFIKRFRTYRISTQQIMLDAGIENERSALIEAGKKLDIETDGSWVRDGVRRYLESHADEQIILIDAVRTARQIEHLRDEFGERFVHVHVTAPVEVVRQRYEARAEPADRRTNYDEVRTDPTEAGVWALDAIANRVVENYQCDPASLLSRASAGLQLFPDRTEPLVDVLVGGQYGSEGKGNICAYLAGSYDILMRVGGPNAGHMVAYPPYKYVQLPSGTGSNDEAKVLIGPGATIWVPQILKEISDRKLTKDRIVIDEQS